MVGVSFICGGGHGRLSDANAANAMSSSGTQAIDMDTLLARAISGARSSTTIGFSFQKLLASRS